MTTKVLVVDDDVAVRVLIRRFLDTESSFEVVGEAGNPSDALLVASQLKPDLVTMDYQMPGGTGDECIREMKSRWPHIHVLALTSAAPKDAKKMIDAGAYAAIDKAHMELVIPAMYQIADRRESDWRSAIGGRSRHQRLVEPRHPIRATPHDHRFDGGRDGQASSRSTSQARGATRSAGGAEGHTDRYQEFELLEGRSSRGDPRGRERGAGVRRARRRMNSRPI